MTDLIVAGAGEGFYKNLYPAIQSTDPDLGMRIATVIDVLPRADLDPKTQEIIESEDIEYVQGLDNFDRRRTRLLSRGRGTAAGVVMTPNDFHLAYAKYFAEALTPVYIEKPLVTSLHDLDELLTSTWWRYYYAAEYCVDGKGIGLLALAGAIDGDDPRRAYLAPVDIVQSGTGQRLFRELGRLKAVHGKLLEGEGAAGKADHRTWLLDGRSGGMIRDLASHLFGVVYDIGLVSDLAIWNFYGVDLGRHDDGMDLGEFRFLRDALEGETYARMRGRFLTPWGEPEFDLEVGKYWPKNDRKLQLFFEEGMIQLSYEKPFMCTMETKRDRLTLSVTADFHVALAFLDFKRFFEGKTHGHIGRAAAIVRFNERAREVGLERHGF